MEGIEKVGNVGAEVGAGDGVTRGLLVEERVLEGGIEEAGTMGESSLLLGEAEGDDEREGDGETVGRLVLGGRVGAT